MTRKIGTIAVIAVVGIGVCFLVIGTPAVTTVRIAGKALASPAERASVWHYTSPSWNRLQLAMMEHPDDWRLRLAEAEGAYTKGGPGQAYPPEESYRSPELYRLMVRRNPEPVVLRSAYVKRLLEEDLTFVHPTYMEAVKEYLREAADQAEAEAIAPYLHPFPATDTELVESLDENLGRLRKLEPENAAWPYLLSLCSFARLDDEAALGYIREAGAKQVWDLHGNDEFAAKVEAYALCGVPRVEATSRLQAYPWFEAWATLITPAGIAGRLADEHESTGELRKACELRTALIDIARLIRRQSDSLIVGAMGSVIVWEAYPGSSRGAGSEQTDALACARERQELFAHQLEAVEMQDLIPQYAQSLEEDLAYIEAAEKFYAETKPVPPPHQRALANAYSPAPVGWMALGTTLAALVIVSIAAAPHRSRGRKPGGRIVVGASIFGGIAALGLLAVSVVLTMRSEYAQGGLFALEGQALWRGTALPPAILGVGVLLAASVAAWAITLMERPRGSRAFVILLAASWAVACALFLLFSRVALDAWAWDWQALTIIGHALLAGVPVWGIAAVLRAWARRKNRRTSPLVPIFGVAGMLAVFCAAFGPISTRLGTTWAVGWNFAIPVHALILGIALILIHGAVAASLFGKPQRRRGERFAIFAPVSAAAFWGYVWFSWFPIPHRIDALTVALHALLGVAAVGAIAAIWSRWSRRKRGEVGVWAPTVATISIGAILSTLWISGKISIPQGWPLFLVLAVPASVAVAALVARRVSTVRLPESKRPSYLDILRPALAACFVWILVVQFASLVWLGVWRAKAAAEIEQAYAVSENQAVLRIMEEAQEGQ